MSVWDIYGTVANGLARSLINFYISGSIPGGAATYAYNETGRIGAHIYPGHEMPIMNKYGVWAIEKIYKIS